MQRPDSNHQESHFLQPSHEALAEKDQLKLHKSQTDCNMLGRCPGAMIEWSHIHPHLQLLSSFSFFLAVVLVRGDSCLSMSEFCCDSGLLTFQAVQIPNVQQSAPV